MPTYQYACTECDHRFDAVQSFSEDSLTDCPKCTGRLRKLFSSVGIVFKGSGFYRTDNRASNGSSTASSKSESTSSSDSAGSSNGSTSSEKSSSSKETASATATS